MNKAVIRHVETQVMDDEVALTMTDLCRSCQVPNKVVEAWVFEGVLLPAGQDPEAWRFNGTMLRRARLARQLAEEMEVNPSGIALALDLLEQIEALRSQLARQGRH